MARAATLWRQWVGTVNGVEESEVRNMAEIKEAVLVDGVRTPNFRAHAEKG